MLSVNVHLRDVTLGSDQFDSDGGRAFTSVKIMDDTGNDVTLFVNADVAATVLALADALRAAALKHMPAPAPEPAQPEPAAVEV